MIFKISIIKNFVIILILVILISLFLEIILFFGYLITNHQYFENYEETRKRSGFVESIENTPNFINEINSNEFKIAIFGGSSANGYSSTIGFETFLKKSLPKKNVIHNYSQNAGPFVNFQSKILNVVSSFYDVIIIYSGHNEIWSHLYSKVNDSNLAISLPDGSIINQNFSHDIRAKNIKKLLNNSKTNNQNIDIFLLTKKIRIANFSRRIYVILNRFINKFQKRKNNQEYKIKYFINEQIVSDLDKKNIYESFNNKVLEIKNNLREDQLLILSTTLTNDLYLPIHDFQSLNDNSIKFLNNKISNFLIKYDFINSNAFDVNNTEDFPDGATLEYLKGVNCLNKNFLKVYPNDFNNCKEFYHAAREADGLPFRTLPSLNSKIRLLKNKYKNIKVIDPDIRLLNEKNNYLFLEYFVDFQHPSALGHSIIAEEILKILSPTKKIKFNKIDKCDNFKIESVEVDEKIKPDVESSKYIIEANIRWLKNFNLKTFKPNLHQFYIKEASIKQKNCYK